MGWPGSWIDEVKANVAEAIPKYAPVAEATIVDWASAQLNQQKKQSDAKAAQVIKDASAAPAPAPGSLAAAFQGVLGQGVLAAKGGQIILLVGAVVLVGVLIGRKS